MAKTIEGGKLDMMPGTQAIVSMKAMDEPLELLPSDAFDSLLVVSTGGHPRKIEEKVREANGNPSEVLVVPVTGSSLRYNGPLRLAERTGPNDLTKIGVNINNGLRELDGTDSWVVFDNINVFLMYADDSRVYRFMDTVVGSARQTNARGVYCTVRDAIADQTYQRFRQLCDEEIDAR